MPTFDIFILEDLGIDSAPPPCFARFLRYLAYTSEGAADSRARVSSTMSHAAALNITENCPIVLTCFGLMKLILSK